MQSLFLFLLHMMMLSTSRNVPKKIFTFTERARTPLAVEVEPTASVLLQMVLVLVGHFVETLILIYTNYLFLTVYEVAVCILECAQGTLYFYRTSWHTIGSRSRTHCLRAS